MEQGQQEETLPQSEEGNELLDLIKEPGVILLIAKPGNGKTYMGKCLAYEGARNNCFEYMTALVSISSKDEDFTWCPKEQLHRGWSDEIGLRIIRQQKDTNNAPALLHMEDCMGHINFKNKVLEQIVTCFRQLNLRVIISIQSLTGTLPSWFLNCLTAVFFGKQQGRENYRSIYNAIAREDFPVFGTFEKFALQLDHQKHEFLLWRSKNNAEKVEDKYVKIIAPAGLPSFVISQKQSQAHAAPEDDDEPDDSSDESLDDS